MNKEQKYVFNQIWSEAAYCFLVFFYNGKERICPSA